MSGHFADRLIAATRRLGPLCVGIDPHWGKLPDVFGADPVQALQGWAMALVDAAGGVAGVVKPQVGLFEAHGPAGMEVLADVMRQARARGLLVIADAKRGDIGSTAEGYARAYLSPDAPFPADALTVNPYMGLDTLEPYLTCAQRYGKGVAVLARTSNPGAGDFQLRDMGGAPLFARVVTALAEARGRLVGRSGWSSLMLVAGATGPQEALVLRTLAPEALVLVPGYGAQGAGAEQALAAFVEGPEGLEGGVVNASRSVSYPEGSFANIAAWTQAARTLMVAAQRELRQAARMGSAS